MGTSGQNSQRAVAHYKPIIIKFVPDLRSPNSSPFRKFRYFENWSFKKEILIFFSKFQVDGSFKVGF